MSFLDIIKGLFGLVPSAIEAGKQVADAVKPSVVIDPDNALLWHNVTYHWPDAKSLGGYCTVCQKVIPYGMANELCREAVRRRNAGLS